MTPARPRPRNRLAPAAFVCAGLASAFVVLSALTSSALGAQSTVVGVVRDSLTGRTLVGATVQLVLQAEPSRGARSVETDSAGGFRIPGVAAGRYLIGFNHVRVDSLGFDTPTRVLDVPAGTSDVRADLAIPSARAIVAALCGARRDTTGLMTGRVVDADREESVVTGAVVVTWGELSFDATGMHRSVRTVRAPVDSSGRYFACGVPTDAPVSVQASAGDARRPTAQSGTIEVKLDPAAPFALRDLLVAAVVASQPPPTDTTPNATSNAPSDSAPATVPLRRGTARLAGRVRRPDGALLAGARVVVRGAGAADSVAVTDAAGAYHLDALPAGTYPIEAIGIGFTPARGAADLRPGRVAAVDLALGKRAAELQRVTVYARYKRPDTEFARRMREGWGRFVTADQIERRAVLSVADALYTVPGLHIGPGRFGRPVIQGRGGCTPDVYLDGMRIPEGATDLDTLVSPFEVGGIEVYTDPNVAPVQYSHGSCASVLVWTKGGMR